MFSILSNGLEFAVMVCYILLLITCTRRMSTTRYICKDNWQEVFFVSRQEERKLVWVGVKLMCPERVFNAIGTRQSSQGHSAHIDTDKVGGGDATHHKTRSTAVCLIR